MVECVYMAVIDVEVSICGKLNTPLHSSTPLLDGCIELIGHVNLS
jgi:hypothetical protein